jgi:hypothetical protein
MVAMADRGQARTWSSGGVARRLKAHERLRPHPVAERRADLLTDVVAFVAKKEGGGDPPGEEGPPPAPRLSCFPDRQAGIPDAVHPAAPREARAHPGYREGRLDSFVRRAARRACRRLPPKDDVTPGGTAAAV